MSRTVFISSTSLDLKDHRQAATQACLSSGYHPLRMEDFGARPADPLTACLEDIQKADIFIGLYAWRYGFIPQGTTVSITEMEFDHAQKLGKPCLCFWVDETYEWPPEHIEGGIGSQKLRHFKAKLHDSLIRATFTSPADLQAKVAASLARLAQEQGQASPPPPPPSVQVNVGSIQEANIAGRDFIQVNNPHAEVEAIRQQLQQKHKQLAQLSFSHLTGGGLETPLFVGIVLVFILGCAASQSTILAIGLGGVLVLASGAYLQQWLQKRQHLSTQIQHLKALLEAKQSDLGS